MDIEMSYTEENDEKTFSVISNLGNVSNNNKCDGNKLPNEIWLMILSYLNFEEMFESFSELNQRFDDLIYDFKNINLSTIMQYWSIKQHIPRLAQNVQKISFRHSDLWDMLTNEWPFKNLQIVNIKRSDFITTLRVGTTPFPDILAAYQTLIEYTESANWRRFKLERQNNTSQDEINQINQCIDNFKSLSFSFIERLSLFECSADDLSIIMNHAPNLVYLQLQTIGTNFFDDITDDELNLNIKQTNLRTLKITKGQPIFNPILQQIIKSSEKTLRNILLNIEFQYPIDGDFLEEILKPCENLKKLDLSLLFEDMYDDIDLCLQSFQSQWWLDQNRPVIFLQPRDSSNVEVISLPNRWDDFTFDSDLTHWYFNKGNLDSPSIRFYNLTKIFINNTTNQPITLDYLHILDKILCSSEQHFGTNQCDLATVDILFELLINDTSMMRALLKVKSFSITPHETFEPMTLCVWILLMPNLEQLMILFSPNFKKLEFGKQLKAIVEKDQRLRSYFDRIKHLAILPKSSGDRLEEESVEDFLDVFRNAHILF